MNFIKKMPATLILITTNIIVFGITYRIIGTFNEPQWSLGLLELGAEFNPYTLGGEWYRLFTHMFLHGHIFHLAFNMYALFIVGREVEWEAGTGKFLLIYFITGVAAALNSLYWGMFTIGVGASGAIFGLFGFSLIVNVFYNRRMGQPVTPILINFVVFLAINLFFAEMLHADNSAHLGGLMCGLLMGAGAILFRHSFQKINTEFVILPLLVICFFLLPRYQVFYFNFFQKVLSTESASSKVLGSHLPDDQFLLEYKKVNKGWDSALYLLNDIPFLPEALHPDTTNLRKYITGRKKEGEFRERMVAQESYIYMDSIEWVQQSMRGANTLQYVLNMKYEAPDTLKEETPQPILEEARIWYDSNWVEIPYPPATYSRVGYHDSMGRWQGPLRDFYKNGDVQMKGNYQADLKHGIFIYYSDHRTYEAAGRYENDRRTGKWESFHPNGKMESEVHYGDRYFMKNYWDENGEQQVKDGFGKETHRYSNGIIATEGNYENGYQQGYWYGRHSNGTMYYEEYYNQGRLIRGRSRSLNGRDVVYDETTLYALPEGGYQKFNEYLDKKTREVNADVSGVVKISFRVTTNGQLTDWKTEQSLSEELDAAARRFIEEGPRWLSAKIHGQEPMDGYGFVTIEF